MTQTTVRNIFVAGTVLFSVVFLILTYDTLKKMPQRTHEEGLTPEVVEGKRTWQKYNCNDCHTILGIGGYYAPDITKVATYRDHDWLERFLSDPHGVWAAERRMPNFHLTKTEIDNLVAFMTWVSHIDTNGWPKKPLMLAGAPEVTSTVKGEAPAAQGPRLFVLHGCQGCHMINGVGGKIGPDLTHEGTKHPDEAWQKAHLKDPRSVHTESAMPAFASLPEAELDALAEYLVTLK